MQVTRPFQALRSSGLRSSIGSGSGGSRHALRSAQADRYLAIRHFFTQQSQCPTPLTSSSSATSLLAQAHRHPFCRRWNSSQPSSTASSSRPCPHCAHQSPPSSLSSPNIPSTPPPPIPPAELRGHPQDYAPFIKRLIKQSKDLAANSTHRPSKEQLLAAANGWWQRLRIRFQWFTIRGWRRFNTDDLSAFASWFVVGNTLWILLGTTTFVSAVFAVLNSLSLQEFVARWISDYMTANTGVTVIFESAIVPKWSSSSITFRNVYISRRPTDNEARPTKTATAKPPSPIPFLSSSLSPDTYMAPPRVSETDNYTMFDINVDEVEVSISLLRWLDGRGLVTDAKTKGVRGVVDRRSVWWDSSKPMNPADFRHATQAGDFEFDSFHVEDALITVYQPGGQRPYNVSIFNAAIGPLRKQWLFYDLMNAEGITGQFDNCLFSLHMPQKLGKVHGEDGHIKRLARFRIDGMPIEHAQYATGHTGPMSWITSGKVDAVLDIKLPHQPEDQVDIKAIFEEIGRNVVTISHGDHPDDHRAAINAAVAATKGSSSSGLIPGQHRLARPPLRAPSGPNDDLSDEEKEKRPQVVVDIDLRFRDLKAAVPIYTTDLSVTNNALIRPIVAFINANRTLVPIHCQVAADLVSVSLRKTLFPADTKFRTTLTGPGLCSRVSVLESVRKKPLLTCIISAGLMTSISDQMYAALAHHVSSEVANSKRIRQVSYWGLQRGAEVLVETLKNVVDPAHAQLAAA